MLSLADNTPAYQKAETQAKARLKSRRSENQKRGKSKHRTRGDPSGPACAKEPLNGTASSNWSDNDEKTWPGSHFHGKKQMSKWNLTWSLKQPFKNGSETTKKLKSAPDSLQTEYPLTSSFGVMDQPKEET